MGGVVYVSLTFVLQFFYSSTRLFPDSDELLIMAWALTPDVMSRCEDALHAAGFLFAPFVTVDALLVSVCKFRDTGAFNRDELLLSKDDFFCAASVLTRELIPIEWADPLVAASAKMTFDAFVDDENNKSLQPAADFFQLIGDPTDNKSDRCRMILAQVFSHLGWKAGDSCMLMVHRVGGFLLRSAAPSNC